MQERAKSVAAVLVPEQVPERLVPERSFQGGFSQDWSSWSWSWLQLRDVL